MLNRLLLTIAILAAIPLSGEELLYHVERIEVRNLQHLSPAIVIDEMHLDQEHSYSEAQLRAGLDRLRRLPFILDAELSLEKGSERGSYVLVVTVDETRPVFYLTEAVQAIEEGSIIRDGAQNRLAAGARLFLGPRSMIHAGMLTRDEDRPGAQRQQIAQIGFTQFGLFGGRAFTTVTLNRAFPGRGEVTPGLVAGLYLGENRTLSLIYDETDSDDFRVRRERVIQLRLARNTTDDPFFPVRGSVLAISPLAIDRTTAISESSGPRVITSESFGVEAELERYWSLNDRMTFSLELQGGYLDAEIDLPDTRREDQFYGSVLTRLSRTLTADGSSESRAEISFSSLSDRDEIFSPRSGYQQLSVSWARVDAWGSVRLGLGYAW